MRVCPKCNLPYPNSVERCVRDQSTLSALQDFLEDNTPLARGNLIGEIIGNYKIHKRLGAGAMGTVYQAQHLSIGKEVAIKILRDDCAQQEAILERFYQEARALAKLNHENIIQILDFGCTQDGLAYLVTELLVGQSLEACLRKESPLGPKRAVSIIGQICRGLEAAHQLKIVHRDLKPDNIFLVRFADNPEFVKILDFGIAKQLDSNTTAGLTKAFVGTPAFMPPEQGSDIDARSDIYSLGIMLYQMLTGTVPFEGANMVDVLYKHLIEAPRPPRELNPNIPASLEAIVLRCLEKQKEQRFPSAQALGQALREAEVYSGPSIPLPKTPESDEPPPKPFQTTLNGGTGEIQSVPEPPKRQSLLIGAVGAAALLLGFGVVWALSGDAPSPTAPPKVEAASQPQSTPQPKEQPAPTPTPEEKPASAPACVEGACPPATPEPTPKEDPKPKVIKPDKKKADPKDTKKPPKDDPFGEAKNPLKP